MIEAEEKELSWEGGQGSGGKGLRSQKVLGSYSKYKEMLLD